MNAAREIAQTILAGFDKHYRIFRETSAAARERFERKRWAELREANRARIDWYDLRVLEAVEIVTRLFPGAADEALWPAIKRAYIALLYDHHQPELAETFFNSVATRVLDRHYHNNEHIFSRPAVATEHIEGAQPTYRCYYPAKVGLRRALFRIFNDFELDVPLAQPRRCMKNLLHAFREWNIQPPKTEPNYHVQVLSSLFYRNKAAYAFGRVINGHRKYLFAIALRHSREGEGLYVDALIHDREHLANLLSVANAYFMVDMEVPASWMSFIHEALPEKPKAELYTAVGLQKQGKTLFIRDLYDHLKHSEDQFTIAPGVRGMVMFVFTLPSFPFVFKVIRDHFEPPKDTSRELVMEKYRLVKLHDRVGRLADTLEYSSIALPVVRFEPAVIEEMRRLIPSNLVIDGDRLVIKHLYIEARMTPLDIYLRARADEAQIRHGVHEFGQALRDLAAANIFPGDLLTKNFGVSPHGRVLFYDYDEVTYLTDCRFRALPSARNLEDEMRASPWYAVGPNDVFPEEFSNFLFGDARAREIFKELHGELLTPAFWIDMQEKIRQGADTDLYPYPEEVRFRSLRAAHAASEHSVP